MRRNVLFQLIAISLMFIVACGSGGDGGSGSTGTMNLALTDASTSDYRAIYVTIRQVEVHKDGGAGWDIVATPNKTYNLLNLVNGVREQLALAILSSGHYTQMRLILADTPDDSLNILSRKHPYGNYFVDNNDQDIELKVPSGFQTGIKIVKGFDINANETTEIILDFDAARSVVRAGSSGKWLLKPTIKMLETKDYCIISGNAGAAGVLVSAQTYHSSAGAVEDEVQIEAATVSDAEGNYKLFVAPGSYTLVGYKDGYAPFFKNTKVVTAAGSTYTENISLISASMGALAGGPVDVGTDPEQYATISIRKDATVGGQLEQIEVKALNVADEGTFETVLPVGSYEAVISSSGKTALVESFTISSGATTDLGAIGF